MTTVKLMRKGDEIGYVSNHDDQSFGMFCPVAIICNDDYTSLIAAASDLLEALEAEQEWRDRQAAGELNPEWDYETMVGNKRRDAIAKATGEPA